MGHIDKQIKRCSVCNGKIDEASYVMIVSIIHGFPENAIYIGSKECYEIFLKRGDERSIDG